jgi:catechol 2,3-dioxygenase-like lactoylglutathione lyase family enzyme
MLHHISLGVADIERAGAFYDAVLAPLGYARVWEDIRPGEADQAIGYGISGGGDKLAIKHRPQGAHPPGPGFHLALAAPGRQAVAHFHHAALRHGGIDNGAPGLRPHYGPTYFAAFVIDPDGHPLEAVFNGVE